MIILHEEFYIHNMCKYMTILQSGRWLYKCKRLVAELFLVFLGHESLATVATVLDLRLVQVDVDPGVAQGCTSITVGVATGDDYHWLLRNQVNGKLLVYLREMGVYIPSYTADMLTLNTHTHRQNIVCTACNKYQYKLIPAYVCR